MSGPNKGRVCGARCAGITCHRHKAQQANFPPPEGETCMDTLPEDVTASMCRQAASFKPKSKAYCALRSLSLVSRSFHARAASFMMSELLPAIAVKKRNIDLSTYNDLSPMQKIELEFGTHCHACGCEGKEVKTHWPFLSRLCDRCFRSETVMYRDVSINGMPFRAIKRCTMVGCHMLRRQLERGLKCPIELYTDLAQCHSFIFDKFADIRERIAELTDVPHDPKLPLKRTVILMSSASFMSPPPQADDLRLLAETVMDEVWTSDVRKAMRSVVRAHHLDLIDPDDVGYFKDSSVPIWDTAINRFEVVPQRARDPKEVGHEIIRRDAATVMKRLREEETALDAVRGGVRIRAMEWLKTKFGKVCDAPVPQRGVRLPEMKWMEWKDHPLAYLCLRAVPGIQTSEFDPSCVPSPDELLLLFEKQYKREFKRLFEFEFALWVHRYKTELIESAIDMHRASCSRYECRVRCPTFTACVLDVDHIARQLVDADQWAVSIRRERSEFGSEVARLGAANDDAARFAALKFAFGGDKLTRKAVNALLGDSPLPIPDDPEGAADWFKKFVVSKVLTRMKECKAAKAAGPRRCPLCEYVEKEREVTGLYHHVDKCHKRLLVLTCTNPLMAWVG
jgi:hypothetical protein